MSNTPINDARTALTDAEIQADNAKRNSETLAAIDRESMLRKLSEVRLTVYALADEIISLQNRIVELHVQLDEH